MRLNVAMDGTGFSATGFAYFTSTDCTGTALLPADINTIKLGHIESDNVAWYGPATASPQSLNSNVAYMQFINDQAGCDGYFGPGRTFIAPHGCCWTLPSSQDMGPAVSVDLSVFTPPFSIVIP